MQHGIRFSRVVVVVLGFACGIATGAERTEHFGTNPRWDGRNYRAVEPTPQEVRQDFGYSGTSHAGGEPGEIGGFVTPAAEPAYYGAEISAATFDSPLEASGTFACGERPFHVLVGFFNAGTLKEWRTPNTIALRLNGRGDVFLGYVEYATSRWRAGGDSPQSFPAVRDPQTGRPALSGFAAKGTEHHWSLKYDPQGNTGQGVITATIDGATAVCNLDEGHKADGAQFNRFGIVTIMKSVDTGGELWMDDITINGRRYDFAEDPGWDASGNRRTYVSPIVRPRFDFGYCPTHFAGGAGPGELGGVVFRGDCRYPEKMAYYGDRLQALSLDKPLKAAGKVALRRGVSDSGVLIGFFDSRESAASNPAQDTGLPKNFFGISTDAPSRDGFYFSPTYRVQGDSRAGPAIDPPIRLLPDGRSHDWSFDYSPTAADGRGRIVVHLDDRKIELPLGEGHKTAGGRFDRFGIITAWIDGNSQTIYFDDLTYTFRQN